MDILPRIVDLIVRERLSTTMACDVMNKTGCLTDIRPLNSGLHVAGEVKYVFAHAGTNYHLHEQVANIEEDKIIYVDAIVCNERAVFGDIVVSYLIQHRRARAIVTNGYIRDVNDLIKDKSPIWCAGATPIGCHKVQEHISPDVQAMVNDRRKLFESSILICDDSGVAMIPPDWINEGFTRKLDLLEAQEEVWHYCVNYLKWSTYETVCLKRYLDEPEFIPPFMLEKLKSFIQKN